jgi:hypothetical protein
MMYWLVKINLNEFEIWTDAQYSIMLQKCEYYGAKPFWQDIKKIESRSSDINYRWEPGEIVPYSQPEQAQRFAIITELLNFKGIHSFKGFDIVSRVPVLSPIPKLA